ncbi:MAG: hypothetical protein J6V20_01610 [Bacteroidaceae bacterium]|nr:hypothetical protein [Bacteroidaceae bacterium]
MENIETLVFAENGFPLEDRLGKVMETLGAKFYELNDRYLAEYNTMIEKGAKKPVLKTIQPYTIKCELYKALSRFKSIDNSVANNLTEEQIMAIFSDFLELVSWLNEYGTFIPSKQIFSAFSGITPTAYTYLMTDGDSEQKEAILAVENFLVDMNMEAASQGMAKERTTEFRMKARGSAGHGIRTATIVDDVVDSAKDVMSQADYNRMLVGIVEKDLIEASKGN